MAKIHFIQYLRPRGQKSHVSIERPDHIAKAADNIVEHGFRFECEVLSNGMASLTISDDFDDYGHELVSANSPAVPAAVDKLVTNFDLAAAIKHRNKLTGA